MCPNYKTNQRVSYFGRFTGRSHYRKKPLSGSIDTFSATIRLISDSKWEPLWNKLIRDYHYLGSEKLLGHRLKYLVFINENPVAALSFSAPALKLRYRDDFIGWSEAQRKKFLSLLVCNSRFLIVPWVTIKNLASHVLSQSLRRLKTEWQRADSLLCSPWFAGNSKSDNKHGHIVDVESTLMFSVSPLPYEDLVQPGCW